MTPRIHIKPGTYHSSAGQAGFTLFETLLVILLFSIMVVLMGSIFIGSLNLQRKAFNLQQAEENASFVLEAMAKEIRVSQISGPDTNCPATPAVSLSITHPVNGNIIYSLSGNSIHRNVNGTDSIMNSNSVEFTNLKFCISGAAVDDGKQPRVTIMASVRSVKTQQQASINVQTTLSQRFLSN
mgnify:CR=1 FL=1